MPESSPTPSVRWNWRRGTRWFAAEFLVVVTGVLVALALNAWLGGRQHAAREQAYLREIARDLARTDSTLARSITGLSRTRHSTAALIRAASTPAPPPADSLVWWLFTAQYIALPTYSKGAAEALLRGSELTLIRADSTRLAVFRMLDQLHQSEVRETMLVQAIVPILQRQRERTAATPIYADVVRISGPGQPFYEYARQLASEQGGALRPPFAVSYESVLRREESFRDWRSVADHLLVLQTGFERTLAVVRDTRRLVEAEIRAR